MNRSVHSVGDISSLFALRKTETLSSNQALYYRGHVWTRIIVWTDLVCCVICLTQIAEKSDSERGRRARKRDKHLPHSSATFRSFLPACLSVCVHRCTHIHTYIHTRQRIVFFFLSPPLSFSFSPFLLRSLSLSVPLCLHSPQQHIDVYRSNWKLITNTSKDNRQTERVKCVSFDDFEKYLHQPHLRHRYLRRPRRRSLVIQEVKFSMLIFLSYRTETDESPSCLTLIRCAPSSQTWRFIWKVRSFCFDHVQWTSLSLNRFSSRVRRSMNFSSPWRQSLVSMIIGPNVWRWINCYSCFCCFCCSSSILQVLCVCVRRFVGRSQLES